MRLPPPDDAQPPAIVLGAAESVGADTYAVEVVGLDRDVVPSSFRVVLQNATAPATLGTATLEDGYCTTPPA